MAFDIKLPGGVKLHFGKKGVSGSVGKRGVGSVGFGPKGGRVRASIPGTGITWSENVPLNSLKKLKEAFVGPSKEDDVKAKFNKEIESKAELICSMCGEKVFSFRDEASKEEFKDTGLCQKCQDEFNK